MPYEKLRTGKLCYPLLYTTNNWGKSDVKQEKKAVRVNELPFAGEGKIRANVKTHLTLARPLFDNADNLNFK